MRFLRDAVRRETRDAGFEVCYATAHPSSRSHGVLGRGILDREIWSHDACPRPARDRVRLRVKPVKRLLRLVPALLYMSLIFYLSSQEAPSVGVSDKLLHVVAYGVLTVLLIFGLAGSMPAAWVALIGATVSFLYGCSDEFHQSFVPNRSAELLDALADAVGSALAALVYLAAHAIWTRFVSPSPAPAKAGAGSQSDSPPAAAGLAQRERVS